MGEATRNWQHDLKIFRERMGGLTEQKKTMAKEQRDATRALEKALKAGPRTVPQLAAETGIPAAKVFWFLMALRKYGKVAEAGRIGDYYLYRWKEVSS
jgi:predicted Rossmann fold nucleotide-binding protein DprA/Smf involved in DNA uptake